MTMPSHSCALFPSLPLSCPLSLPRYRSLSLVVPHTSSYARSCMAWHDMRDSFVTRSWLVRDLFVIRSWLIRDLLLSHSWLIPDLRDTLIYCSPTHIDTWSCASQRDLFVRLVRDVRDSFVTRLRVIHDSFLPRVWLSSPTRIESHMIVCSIRDVFEIYLQFARDLFVTRSWLLYSSPPRIASYMGVVIRPWLVRDLFVTRSWLLYRSPTRIESYMIVRGLTHVALRGHTGKISQKSAAYWGHHIINTTKAIWEFLHDARQAVGAHR